MYFLRPRNASDLTRRMKAHKAIADATYGMLGRSMDYVASFVTGMAMMPGVFDTEAHALGVNGSRYYRHMREHDIFAAYAVIPPQAARNPEFYER